MIRKIAALFTGLIIFAVAARAEPIPQPLAFVPNAARAVVVIDVKQVAGSEAFKVFMTRSDGERFRSTLAKIKEKSGVDVLGDIARITLFGKADRAEAGGMILEGRFDEAKLVARLQANPQYRSFSDGGLIIHQWFDKTEKYGCFPAEGMIAVWNSRLALDESLSAREDPKQQFMLNSDVQQVVDMQRLFANTAEQFRPAVWAAAIPRTDGGVIEQMGVKAAYATLSRQGNQVLMQARLGAQTPESASQLADFVKGWIAFGQMQERRPLLSELAKNTKVVLDRNQVKIETRFEQARVSELVGMPRPERQRPIGSPANPQ